MPLFFMGSYNIKINYRHINYFKSIHFLKQTNGATAIIVSFYVDCLDVKCLFL